MIFDRTETAAPEARTWLLHSLQPAEILGNTITIKDGAGALWSKTLLPEDITISQAMVTAGNKGRTDNHIYVVPTENQQTHLNFLTVLHASAAGTLEPLAVEAIGNNGVKGPGFEIHFGLEGAPSGTIRLEKDGQRVDRALSITPPEDMM